MMETDCLEDLLEDCTVRVDIPGSSGTGFFIAPGWLLTCAHVIGKTEGTIQVFWKKTDRYYMAKIECQIAIPIDLALLKLINKLDGHPCVYFDPSKPATDDLMVSYGYPKERKKGDSYKFRFVGTSEEESELKFYKVQGEEPKGGTSGSPLLNLYTGQVCGMVNRSSRPDVARAVPWVLIEQHLSELAPEHELVLKNKRFHQHDKRWRNLLPCLQPQDLSSRFINYVWGAIFLIAILPVWLVVGLFVGFPFPIREGSSLLKCCLPFAERKMVFELNTGFSRLTRSFSSPRSPAQKTIRQLNKQESKYWLYMTLINILASRKAESYSRVAEALRILKDQRSFLATELKHELNNGRTFLHRYLRLVRNISERLQEQLQGDSDKLEKVIDRLYESARYRNAPPESLLEQLTEYLNRYKGEVGLSSLIQLRRIKYLLYYVWRYALLKSNSHSNSPKPTSPNSTTGGKRTENSKPEGSSNDPSIPDYPLLERDRLAEQIDKLRCQNNSEEERLGRVRKWHEEVKRDLATSGKELWQTWTVHEQLQTGVSNLRADQEKLERSITPLEQQRDTLQTELHNLQAEVSSLRQSLLNMKQIDTSLEALQSLSTSMQSFTETYQFQQEPIGEIPELHQSLQEFAAKADALLQLLKESKLESSLTELYEKLHGPVQLSELREEIEQLKTDKQSLDQGIRQSVEKKQRLNQEIEQSKAQKQRLNQEIEQLKAQKQPQDGIPVDDIPSHLLRSSVHSPQIDSRPVNNPVQQRQGS